MAPKEFFTTGDVSQLVNISRATVSRKFDAGILYGKKNPITSERLISRESLLSFMKKYNIPLREIEKTPPKYILLGSNDKQLQFLMRKTFSDDDRINVHEVTSGYDVLIICSKTQPDLLIIDEELPDISFKEAVKSLRRLDKQKKLKVLCCLKKYNHDEIIEIGADDCIAKDNMETDDLSYRISTLLNISKSAQSQEAKFDHRRRWQRLSVDIPANLDIFLVKNPNSRESGNANVENISIGGAYLSQIHLERENIPGDTFRFVLNINELLLKNWQAECKIIRLKGNGSLSAGVEFVSITQQNINKISNIVK